MRKLTHYGVVVVNYVDIDGKERRELIPCTNKNEWLKTCGEADDKYRKLKEDEEILYYSISAKRRI